MYGVRRLHCQSPLSDTTLAAAHIVDNWTIVMKKTVHTRSRVVVVTFETAQGVNGVKSRYVGQRLYEVHVSFDCKLLFRSLVSCSCRAAVRWTNTASATTNNQQLFPRVIGTTSPLVGLGERQNFKIYFWLRFIYFYLIFWRIRLRWQKDHQRPAAEPME